MRAIIIEDKDSRDLLDKLALEKFIGCHPFLSEEIRLKFPNEMKELTDAVHRRFHYIVCRWLQDQGCNVVR